MGLTLIACDLLCTGKGVPLGVSAGDEDIETWIYRNADIQSDSFLKLVVIFGSIHSISTLTITTYCISKSNLLGKKQTHPICHNKRKGELESVSFAGLLINFEMQIQGIWCKDLLAWSNDSNNWPTITVALKFVAL